MKARVMVAVLALCLGGCGVLNTTPPDYVKDVVAYKEGDGLVVYFILADASGQMTTAAGTAYLHIQAKESEVVLFATRMTVEASDFRQAQVGLGAFEHDAVLCSFGRIRYSDFFYKPSGAARVVLSFELSSGRVLEGEDTILF